MTSNTRLSILKPGRPREPLQDLSQLLPTNDDEETTTTDNHKRRVSFACVNKVKEFETEAECTTLRQTPAYDERFSMSSDSYQSSLLSEVSHNKSTFLSYADASKISNRSKAYGENIDVVELGLHSVSRGARSPGKIGGGDSSMDITSVIVRNEHEYTDYDSSSESYYPLNLTKSASSRQSIARVNAADDKDVLETSSMETTEALPCLMTETIMTDFESFSQTMDISVEEVAAEEEKTSRSSMNLTMGPEKVFHFRESTTLLSEKDVQFTVDAFGDLKDSRVQENTFVKSQLISFPEDRSCPMEEDTSIFRLQNLIVDKENNHPLSENTHIEDENSQVEEENDSHVEETEVIEREMDISLSKTFIPAKETFCSISNVFENLKEDTQSAAVIEIQEKDATSLGNSFTGEKTEEPLENLTKNADEEKMSLSDKNLAIEADADMSFTENAVNYEEHPIVESIVVETEELRSVENSVLEKNEQSQFVASPVSEEKIQLQSPNHSIVEERKIQLQSPTHSIVEEEKNQLRSPTHSVLEEEKIQLRSPTHSVLEEEKIQLRSPTHSVLEEEKIQLRSPTRSILEEEKMQLQSIQSPAAEEEKQLKSAENSVVEENDVQHEKHETILSEELQNCQIVENDHMEEEGDPHVDERETEEKSPIKMTLSVVEKSLHLSESIVPEKENIQSRENTVVEEEVLQHVETNPAEAISSSRPLKRKSDSFLPEVPPTEPSPKRVNTEAKSEIAKKNEMIQNQIEKALQSEIPCWTVISMTDSEWKFGALWNRLHLVITLPENENQCVSKLRFMKKHSENGDIGDEILKVAIAPIIRKYRKKMDELCGKVEDVIIFMKMTLPSINFAENFAENFSEIIEFEDISLNNGFASFLVANYGAHLLAKIQVDMRNIDDFSNSSIEVEQHIGRIDEVKVRKIFFEARGDFDFFSKFVKNLNCMLTVT